MQWTNQLVREQIADGDYRVKMFRVGLRDLIVFMSGLAQPTRPDCLMIPAPTPECLPRDGKVKILGFSPNYPGNGFDVLLYHPSWDVVPQFSDVPTTEPVIFEMVKLVRRGPAETPEYYEVTPDITV